MNDVRTVLAQAWNKLHAVGKTFNLKETLNGAGLDALITELDDIEKLVQEAKSRACGYMTDVVYAIAKETAPGEYSALTHGPHPSMDAMLECSPEDGEILVRITMQEGAPQYEELKGYLDGEWIDC